MREMSQKIMLGGLMSFVVFMICASATAGLVDVTANGIVDFVSGEGPSFFLDGSVTVGTPCIINYTYDTTTLDTLPTDVKNGRYALSNWLITLGNYVATDSSNWINISDDVQEGIPPVSEADYYVAEGDGSANDVVFPPFGFGFDTLSSYWSFISLIDRDPPDAIASDALIMPNLSDWASSKSFGIMFGSVEGGDIEIIGYVTTLTPEPATVLLLGLGGLALLKKRKV